MMVTGLLQFLQNITLFLKFNNEWIIFLKSKHIVMGSRCRTAVEHTPYDREVMCLNPAEC